VDARFVMLEVHHRRVQRMLGTAFHRVEIADGRAALQAAGRTDRAGLEQQCLGQAGLAGAGLTDERQRADVLGRGLRRR